MSRAARQTSSTGYYHIIMRGDNRNWIFKQRQYKLDFMEMLEGQEKEARIEMAAWCIMDNHMHLVLKADCHTGRFLDQTVPGDLKCLNRLRNEEIVKLG